MSTKNTFSIVQRPKSNGGVKYVCNEPIQGETKPWAIYVPQALVRKGDDYEESITMTLEAE